MFSLKLNFPSLLCRLFAPHMGIYYEHFSYCVCLGRHPLPQVQITATDKAVPNLSMETQPLLFRHISLSILIFHLDVTQSCQFKCLKTGSLCFFYPLSYSFWNGNPCPGEWHHSLTFDCEEPGNFAPHYFKQSNLLSNPVYSTY